MVTKLSNRVIVLFTILFTFLLSNCKDEDETSVRNFMPIGVEIMQDGINTITLSWKPVNFTESYTCQLYSDEEYQNLLIENTTTTPTTSFSGLTNKATYYYQIRSNNSNSALTSKWQKGKFVCTRETILNEPEVSADSVTITWNRLIETLSHFTVSHDSSVATFNLTAGDIQKQMVILRNILPSTTYTVKLFIDTTLIDAISFTTKQISNQTLFLSPKDNLIDAINNCADGATIHLSEGVYAYGDKEIVIKDKSLTIESSSIDEDNYPEVHIKKFSLKGNVGNLIINNISLTGFALGGKSPEEKNDYFIDMTSDLVKADSIIIRGCTIHYLNNCAIRGSRGLGQQSVKYIEFSNCDLTDINSEGKNQYELFKLDSLQINEFILSNCTIYNTGHGLINNRNNYSANVNIKIEDCTFNDFGSTSAIPRKYLLEFSKTTGNLIFNNNILSNLKGYTENASSMSKGFSLGNLNSYATNNLFYNMPFTVQEVTNWTNATDNYDDIDPQYEDAGIGNFTIQNTSEPYLKTMGAFQWR